MRKPAVVPLSVFASTLLLLSTFVLLGCGREASQPTAEAASPPAPITIEATPPPAPPITRQVVDVAPIPPAPRHEHRSTVDPSACRGGNDEGVAVAETAVHRWTDANGVRHFADRPPVEAAADHRVIAVTGTPPIGIDASGFDVNLPDDLGRRAVAEALAIDRVLRDVLRVPSDRRLRLKVVFVQSPDAYRRVVDDPRLADSDGVYSARDHTVYVRAQPGDELAVRVLRHEIAHALLHARVGNLPLPVNEGIAAYFERLDVDGSQAEVRWPDQAAWPAGVVPDDGKAALVDLLSADASRFYDAERDRHYLRAFALVAVLMGDAAGRDALARLLAAQYASPCVPVAAERELDAAWPGGLSALTASWVDFLRAPTQPAHRY